MYQWITFDCYGTLIDWESGMLEALKSLTSHLSPLLSRDAILQAHGRHESAQQTFTPALRYCELLAIVYKRLAEEWQVTVNWDECLAYGNSIKDWPAFPDSATALAYLKQHYKLVILSNVDNASFAHSNAKLRVTFDAIYTAQDIGSYKPQLRNFEYMLGKIQTIGIEKADVLHTAESLFHDHGPANQMGLASCWIHRRHDKLGFGATMDPVEMPKYDFRFNSMAELVEAHQRELGR